MKKLLQSDEREELCKCGIRGFLCCWGRVVASTKACHRPAKCPRMPQQMVGLVGEGRQGGGNGDRLDLGARCTCQPLIAVFISSSLFPFFLLLIGKVIFYFLFCREWLLV